MKGLLTGAHAILYSRNPEADRAFLRDVLGLAHVDVGDGWLIFALPPTELAVHPASRSRHELYLMCDDIDAFVAAMKKKDVACSPVQDLSWGRRAQIKLPGGGKLGIYEPRHARPSEG